MSVATRHPALRTGLPDLFAVPPPAVFFRRPSFSSPLSD